MIGLTAGAGREIITPPVGGRLYGYAPDVYSDSVNDDLTATAVVFKSGGATAALVSATVCLINTELSDEIRAAVSGETGIPAGNVILCATHTHSGPCTAGNTGWGEVDRGYVDSTFIPKILAAVKTALGGLRPVVLGVGRVHSDIGVNRRQFNKDNTISLGQNPWGCYDPAMTVLSFRSEAGEPVANIVHYGAHCTAAGKNAEITRDWAGVMIDRLEAESGALTMFINGAEGDVGPRLTNGQTVGNIRYAMEHGALAANDAVRAYKKIAEYRQAGLACACGTIELPYAPVMPLELAREELKKFGSQNQINLGGRAYEYLSSVAAAYETGLPAETGFRFRQTVLRVGPVVFIPFPFEFFSEISLRLRRFATFPHVLCAGCANGNNGYLPSRDQICRGGYEIDMFRTSGVQTLADTADDSIVAQNLKLTEELLCTE